MMKNSLLHSIVLLFKLNKCTCIFMFYWSFNEVNRIRTAHAPMSSRLLLARYFNFKNRYHFFFFFPPDWMRRRCLLELFIHVYFFRPLVWVENQASCHGRCFPHFIYCGTHIFHCFSTLLKHRRWHESVFCIVWWDIFMWSDWQPIIRSDSNQRPIDQEELSLITLHSSSLILYVVHWSFPAGGAVYLSV